MKKIMYVFLILCVFTISAFSEIRKAKVSYIEGKALLKQKSGSDWKNIEIGTIVSEGDKIQTKFGSRVELLLDDKSKILIDENTIMDINNLSKKHKIKKTKFKLLFGNMNLRVTKLKSLKDSFKVATPVAVCGVRGTEFDVSNGKNGSGFSVSDGVVEVVSGGKKVVLKKNQQVAVKKQGEISKVKKMKSKPKDNIAPTIEHSGDKQIDAKTLDKKGLKINATIKDNKYIRNASVVFRFEGFNYSRRVKLRPKDGNNYNTLLRFKSSKKRKPTGVFYTIYASDGRNHTKSSEYYVKILSKEEIKKDDKIDTEVKTETQPIKTGLISETKPVESSSKDTVPTPTPETTKTEIVLQPLLITSSLTFTRKNTNPTLILTTSNYRQYVNDKTFEIVGNVSSENQIKLGSISGKGTPNSAIELTVGSMTYNTTSDNSGNWSVTNIEISMMPDEIYALWNDEEIVISGGSFQKILVLEEGDKNPVFNPQIIEKEKKLEIVLKETVTSNTGESKEQTKNYKGSISKRITQGASQLMPFVDTISPIISLIEHEVNSKKTSVKLSVTIDDAEPTSGVWKVNINGQEMVRKEGSEKDSHQVWEITLPLEKTKELPPPPPGHGDFTSKTQKVSISITVEDNAENKTLQDQEIIIQ